VIHDLLAFLAEEMIEMNKQKQEAIRGILLWLKSRMVTEVGASINETEVGKDPWPLKTRPF